MTKRRRVVPDEYLYQVALKVELEELYQLPELVDDRTEAAVELSTLEPVEWTTQAWTCPWSWTMSWTRSD